MWNDTYRVYSAFVLTCNLYLYHVNFCFRNGQTGRNLRNLSTKMDFLRLLHSLLHLNISTQWLVHRRSIGDHRWPPNYGPSIRFVVQQSIFVTNIEDAEKGYQCSSTNDCITTSDRSQVFEGIGTIHVQWGGESIQGDLE